MAEQQQFYLLLSNLMSPDNTVRKQSEVWKSARDRFVWMYVGKSNVISIRSFSAGRWASLWPSTCVKRALLLCGSESLQRVDSFQRTNSRGNKLLFFWVISQNFSSCGSLPYFCGVCNVILSIDVCCHFLFLLFGFNYLILDYIILLRYVWLYF